MNIEYSDINFDKNNAARIKIIFPFIKSPKT